MENTTYVGELTSRDVGSVVTIRSEARTDDGNAWILRGTLVKVTHRLEITDLGNEEPRTLVSVVLDPTRKPATFNISSNELAAVSQAG